MARPWMDFREQLPNKYQKISLDLAVVNPTCLGSFWFLSPDPGFTNTMDRDFS